MRIVLGVTGGIAAYKAVLLARRFVEAGHTLHVVPTEHALRFVGAPTWEAISRNRVTASVHDDVPEVRHVALGQRADLIVIAPATANTLAKMAAGIADDLLGTTLLASRAPVLVAPAMHTEMWEHPATQANLTVLRDRGVHVIGPDRGRLTGDDSGVGRMTEPDDIFARAAELLRVTDGDLRDRSVLVSAGGTREPIDPVRFLGNRSSGRQGIALAAEAAGRGATVTLVAANIEAQLLAELPSAVRIERVTTAAELQAVMRAQRPRHDTVIMTAAVADYRVAEVAETKLRKEDAGGEPVLRLTENPDILRQLVADRAAAPTDPPRQIIVGFAAETVADDAELLDRGRRKLARKGCDLLAVNPVGWEQGFETADNDAVILAADSDSVRRVRGSKREVARALLTAVRDRTQQDPRCGP